MKDLKIAYLSIDEFFEEGELQNAESHMAFYDWMQNFQDISAAKRVLEIDTGLELYNKFLEHKMKNNESRYRI